MNVQDNKFNYKIIFVALVAVIIGVLLAFYYSYAQSKSEIAFLEREKAILMQDLSLMKTDVDRLSALNEVNEIELESSKYRIQQLLDSVGQLNFTVEKLREYKSELRRLEAKNDSLKLKNNFLRYNNMLLSEKYEKTKKELEQLKGKSMSLAEAEALQRKKIQELNQELKSKSYLTLQNTEGSGFRLRSGKPINTNKASIIEKLRGCVTVKADITEMNTTKVIYYQFLDPDMRVIEDNANTISVNGNVYSKRVEFKFSGEDTNICDFITIPQGSLQEGMYRLNIFEGQKLLSTSEFELK
ncbi:hypothetical protein [Pseudozobellia thermophila]|uniref:Chromosome partitioning protein ParA n=1 Tax=Pseudozobellia thermophila TaxID=192903 RepID=A0A1M6ASC8_9FLAO|nr:hypothetical protein [Pseudozobellia thermophila]SHI39372.1 hypothetical protein SAMN04488513_101165 [Pseudozobellia thermophila]